MPATIDIIAMNLVGKSEDEMLSHIWACHDEIRLLRRDIETHEELTAMVRLLPTTADGKPVAPGMDAWELRASGEIRKCYVLSVYTDKAECRCGWDGPDPAWHRCYSSETAAAKAKQERA